MLGILECSLADTFIFIISIAEKIAHVCRKNCSIIVFGITLRFMFEVGFRYFITFSTSSFQPRCRRPLGFPTKFGLTVRQFLPLCSITLLSLALFGVFTDIDAMSRSTWLSVVFGLRGSV